MNTVPGVYPGISPVVSGTAKPRKMLTMSLFLLGHNVQTHNNSLPNLIRGVGERVLYRNKDLLLPVRPAHQVFRTRLAKYHEAVSRDVGIQSPVAREVFVSYYKGPRRLIYQRAVDALALLPVRPKDANLKTFVKAEKHNFTIKPDPAPRVIQPRSPRYNVEVGCYLRPLEKKLYSAIDRLFNTPAIMSPYNAYTQATHLRAKWDRFTQPCCVGIDASRFDQHVSPQALRFEHSVYDRIFRSAQLRRLLKMQISNRGVARASDGFFRYEVEGSRMSGDMNTSMGNKLLMCLMSHSYLSTLNVPFEYANNGDDCLIFLERKHLKKLDSLEEYFRDFGFDIVRESPVTEFEKIEFCQTMPVVSNGIWRMVRKPYTCLTKDVTSVTLGHDIEMYRRLLGDIGDCGLATCADVPVMGSFYRMLKRFGLPGNYMGKWDTEFQYYYRSSLNATCKNSAPDAYGRYSFWLMSGISPDAQASIEKYFNESVWGADKRQIINQLLPIWPL